MPTEKEWLEWSVGFTLPSGMHIAKRPQRDGRELYSVAEHYGSHFFWTTDEQWEYEPIPSERTEEYLRRARYGSLEEAWDAAERAREIAIGGD